VRRALLVLTLCVVAAGCGSSSSPRSSNPLAAELSYFPAGSPFVATVATNAQGTAVEDAESLLAAFPLAKLGITALESQLTSSGVDYQSEVEPLFGNPIVLGAPEAPSRASASFLAVWVTKSAAELATLVKGLHGVTGAGTLDGAALYRRGSVVLALDGPTVVLGSSAPEVGAALARHAHGGGLTPSAYASAMGNLSRSTLVQAFGSLAATLPASARRVPWVAAIRGYAASLSVTSSGVSVQLRLDTSGGALTASELPIAAGSAPPALAGKLPIAVGLHDPAQTIAFLEGATRSADPAGYARFARRENAARRKTGDDLDTFAALLTGNLIVESDTHTTMGRADVSDPASAARQLAKLAPFLGAKASAGGFYSLAVARGKVVNLGLVGSELVAGRASVAQLRAFAAAPTTPVANAQGSLAFRISLLELARLGLGKTANPFLAPVLGALGDITGSASATPAGVAGQAGLRVK
jgi:hypothetical protein